MLGVVLVAFLGERLRVTYRTELTGCARDDGTGGAGGVFRWAGRIGVPVQLLEVPIHEASQAIRAPAGNCVVTMGDGPWSPTREDLDSPAWSSTRDWVARGNALLIVTAAPANLPSDFRRDFIQPYFAEAVVESLPFAGRGSVDNRPETTQAPVTSGGILTVEKNGPRLTVSSHPKVAAGASGPKVPSPGPDADPARWRLAGDERGGVLFRIPVGKGTVYVLLDEFAWTNAGLDHGDNARVLAEILGRELRGGVLAFDEYRHNHGRRESFLAYLLNLPGSSAFLWLAAGWMLLYFHAANVRLRPVEAYVERERRTAQEYIDAVAQLYERARAAPLVVQAVALRLRQVSRCSAEDSPVVEQLLRIAESHARKGDRPASPSAAMHLVTELIQLRKRLYGTRTLS